MYIFSERNLGYSMSVVLLFLSQTSVKCYFLSVDIKGPWWRFWSWRSDINHFIFTLKNKVRQNKHFGWLLYIKEKQIWWNICDALRDLVSFVQFKNVKNTHGGVLLLIACNFNKSSTPLWLFFTFFELCNWHQIPQSIYDTSSTACTTDSAMGYILSTITSFRLVLWNLV